VAVDLEVTVRHELARVATGAGEAGAVDDVVEARLEDLQEVSPVLPGGAPPPCSSGRNCFSMTP
jgi:hypothetical protein